MLKIRLHRTGKTRRPYFRVVIVEHTQAAQGPYLRSLGFWDPIKHKLTLDKEELATWLSRGARPTDRISRLLKKEGIKHKLITIHERPARGPKKLEPKPEPAEKVAVSEQASVEVESPKEPAQVPVEEKSAAPVAEAKPEASKEPVKEEAKAPSNEARAEQVAESKTEAEQTPPTSKAETPVVEGDEPASSAGPPERRKSAAKVSKSEKKGK